MHFQTIDNVSLLGKKVIVRTDLNVPMSGKTIVDELRIDRTLPTLQKLIIH